MTHELHIQLTNSEGALLRALGLIKRRGFQLREVACRNNESGQQLTVGIDTGHGRPEVLCRQLERLHDVISVYMAPQTPPLSVDMDSRNPFPATVHPAASPPVSVGGSGT